MFLFGGCKSLFLHTCTKIVVDPSYATARPWFTAALVFSSHNKVCSAITHISCISFVMEMSPHKLWGLQDPIPVVAWTLARVPCE